MRVIGPMHSRHALFQFGNGHRAAPDLSMSRHATRNDPQTTSGPTIGQRVAHRFWARSRDHAPIDVVRGPIQIDYGPRDARHHHCGTALLRDRLCQEVHITILETQASHIRIAHFGENGSFVMTTAVWGRDHDRTGTFVQCGCVEWLRTGFLRLESLAPIAAKITLIHLPIVARQLRGVKGTCANARRCCLNQGLVKRDVLEAQT